MALNSAALAYSDKIMRDYLENMDESMKKDWETTYPDIVQRDEIMRAKAFDNASWNCDSKYYSLENESLMIADRADRANNYASIIRNGGGSKSDYANLGLGEDFVPLNDYTEKTGFFGLGEANRKGLKTKLSEMQGNDENAVAVRDDLNARIAKYESMAAAQDNDCKKYNEQYAQFTDNMSLTMAERNLASAFARGASEEEINNLSTEWAKLNVDYYNKYEKDMVVNSQADAQKASERASEIAAFKELLGIEDSSKTASATQPAVSAAEKETVKTETVTESESKTTDQSEAKKDSVEVETAESKTVEVKEVKSSSDEKTEPVSEKPNPYAFEKPVCPPSMPGSAYEAMCREQEAAHIKEVNAKIADEIWTKGNWGNGQERIDKLTAAGYDVAGVQAAINEKIAKINETSSTKTVSVATPEMKSADTKANQAVSDETEKSDSSVLKDDSGKSTKTWTDEKGNEITDVTITDKNSPIYNTMSRSIKCPDGKTWSIAYGADGKPDNARCVDPSTSTFTDIKYNENGYKELTETYDIINGRPSNMPTHIVSYDGTENGIKVSDATYDRENRTITERFYDSDGNVIKSDFRGLDSADNTPAYEDEQPGFQPADEIDTISPKTTAPSKNPPRRSLGNPTVEKPLDRTEEKPPKADKNSPYLQPGEVRPFNPYVKEPAFDPHLDVPRGDLSVDVPKGDLKIDTPKFDPYVDIKISPYISMTESKAAQSPKSPKKVSSSLLDAGAHMADSVGTSGHSASFSNGPDAD